MYPDKFSTIHFAHQHRIGAMGQSEMFLPETPEIQENTFFQQLQDAPVYALDLETTGLDPLAHDILLITLATPDMACTFRPDHWAILERLFTNDDKQWLIQHAPFDAGFIYAKYGIALSGDQVYDTRFHEKGLHPKSSAALTDMCWRYFGKHLDKTQQTSFVGHEPGKIFTADQLQYAALDALVLFPIYEKQTKAGAKLDPATSSDRLAQMYAYVDGHTKHPPDLR